MKILLTGGNGFVGRNLEQRLKTEYGHSIISPNSSSFNLLFESSCEKILDLCEPDVVIHAAGTVGGIGANKENPGKFIYENLLMGINMIHKSMIKRVKKFVLLGTVCSYPKFTQTPFKECDLWNGYPEETNAPYGIAKKTLGEMLAAYNAQYKMNCSYLLPCNMYGPFDHFNLTSSHVIPALILKIQKAKYRQEKEIILWGTGKPTREFLFVEDLADAISGAINNDTTPEPINVGTGIETSILEVAELLKQKMKYDGKIVFDDTKPDGQPRRCLDVSKAKNLLGFEAKTSLNEGLDKTLKYFNGVY
jgi:GDP-L-fucose synthase